MHHVIETPKLNMKASSGKILVILLNKTIDDYILFMMDPISSLWFASPSRRCCFFVFSLFFFSNKKIKYLIRISSSLIPE